ncbi:MAG: class I SAM-dependent methyltransferase, partial [Verrucomicrobiota bacterium]
MSHTGKTIESSDDRKDFFNARAENWLTNCYADEQDNIPDTVKEKIDRLFTLFPLSSGDVVVDLGCGDGILVNPVLHRIGNTGRLFEIDYAEEMIRENQERHQDTRITFLTADVMNLPLQAETCDAVIA